MKFFLWLIFCTAVLLPVAFFAFLSSSYEKFTLPVSHAGINYSVEFYLPHLSKWKPVVSNQKNGSITIEYVSNNQWLEEGLGEVAGVVTLEKTGRTSNLSSYELDLMNPVLRKTRFFSDPKVENNELVVSTIVIKDLPGYYVLSVSKNLKAPCKLSDTKSIAQAVVSSLRLEEATTRSDNSVGVYQILASQGFDWPSQTASCF